MLNETLSVWKKDLKSILIPGRNYNQNLPLSEHTLISNLDGHDNMQEGNSKEVYQTKEKIKEGIGDNHIYDEPTKIVRNQSFPIKSELKKAAEIRKVKESCTCACTMKIPYLYKTEN